jgi:hypothetical protein
MAGEPAVRRRSVTISATNTRRKGNTCVDEAMVHKHSYDIDFDLLNRVFDAIHVAHPKIKIFGAETPSPILRGMNIWCINVNSFDTDVLEEQHALGNHVWWYNYSRSRWREYRR